MLWTTLVACGSATAEPTPGQPWPAPGGPVPLAGLVVRVAPAVLATPDPRFHGDPDRYAGQDAPARWTEDQRISAAARDLADLLHLPLAAWAGEAGGVRVGRPEDFDLSSPFTVATPLTREQHAIRTIAGGALVLGVEAAGVEDAVWDLARELGYRWYLPAPGWEIPPTATALPRLDRVDPGPKLAGRRLSGPVNGRQGQDFARWSMRNGFLGALEVRGIQGQWGPIADAIRPWVDANPGAVSASSRPAAHDGHTPQVKWCPAYRDRAGVGVADRIADDWVRPRLSWPPAKYDNTISRDAVFLHQGDSAYWVGCDDRSTPADRAVDLADGVVKRLGPALGDRWVSVFGYREVFPGPRRARVDPRLFVWLVGRGYLGVRLDDAAARWRKAGARHLGWYPYWDGPADLPGDDVSFLAVRSEAEQIRARVRDGFEALFAEQDAPPGLGGWWKWVLMDVARDPSGDDPVGRRLGDLVDHAFPAQARAPMRRFFDRWDATDQRIPVSREWVGALYADLGEARKAARADPGASRRIEDLLVVARYLELVVAQRAGGPEEPVRELVACAADRGMLDRGPSRAGCALDFDGWLRRAPSPATVPWWPGEEGGYARATKFPGSARSGACGTEVVGQPRDGELWKIWVDPGQGATLRSTCFGSATAEGDDPARSHLTRRLVGRGGLVLRNARGAAACTVDLPADRRARDVRLSSAGVDLDPADPRGTRCLDRAQESPIDTGAPDDPDGSCSGFAAEGLYTLAAVNQRSGFVEKLLDGAAGVSRWESPFGPYDDREAHQSPTCRYFYVPVGQKSLTVYTTGRTCRILRDSDPAHAVNVGGRGPGFQTLPTMGHDGEIWEWTGCAGVWLVDVPPVVAPKAEQLLVPCGLVEDPARAADVARLGVDPGDCRD